MGKNYKKQYETLVEEINRLFEESKEAAKDLKEPDWPDEIDDIKKVIWFRNGVFDRAFFCGRRSAFTELAHVIIPKINEMTEP